MLSMPPETTMLAGAADLVDGGGAGGIGKAGAARRLSCRSLTLSGRQDVTHEDFVDPFGCQFCAFQRGADDVGAELVGAERRQFAHESPQRGAGGRQNDDGIGGSHDGTPQEIGRDRYCMTYII